MLYYFQIPKYLFHMLLLAGIYERTQNSFINQVWISRAVNAVLRLYLWLLQCIDQQKALRCECTNTIEIVLEIGMASAYFYFNITFLIDIAVPAG